MSQNILGWLLFNWQPLAGAIIVGIAIHLLIVRRFFLTRQNRRRKTADIPYIVAPAEDIQYIGSLVNWMSQGALQFPTPRKVRDFSPDGQFVFVEGSGTGIPRDQIVVISLPVVKEPFSARKWIISRIRRLRWWLRQTRVSRIAELYRWRAEKKFRAFVEEAGFPVIFAGALFALGLLYAGWKSWNGTKFVFGWAMLNWKPLALAIVAGTSLYFIGRYFYKKLTETKKDEKKEKKPWFWPMVGRVATAAWGFLFSLRMLVVLVVLTVAWAVRSDKQKQHEKAIARATQFENCKADFNDEVCHYKRIKFWKTIRKGNTEPIRIPDGYALTWPDDVPLSCTTRKEGLDKYVFFETSADSVRTQFDLFQAHLKPGTKSTGSCTKTPVSSG